MSKKVSLLLREYFLENEKKIQVPENSFDNPVSVAPCGWDVYTDPERFSRKFKFESRHRLYDFLSEVLSFEDSLGHHGEIRIVFNEVTIEVYTHNINRITDLDQEYTRSIDSIYRDILDFEYR